MSERIKNDYSLRIVLQQKEQNLFLIKLFRGTSGKKRRKLFQFVSCEIPKVKQVIELYKYHESWHQSSISAN